MIDDKPNGLPSLPEQEQSIHSRIKLLRDKLDTDQGKMADIFAEKLAPLEEIITKIDEDSPDFKDIEAVAGVFDGNINVTASQAEGAFNKYPLLRKTYEEHKEEIESIRQIKKDLGELCLEAIPKFQEEITDRAKQIERRIDYPKAVDSMIVSGHSHADLESINNLGYAAFVLQPLSDIPLSDAYYEYWRLEELSVKVSFAGIALKAYTAESAQTPSSNEEIEQAQKTLRTTELKRLNACRNIQDEINYAHPALFRKAIPKTPFLDRFSGYRSSLDFGSELDLPNIISYNPNFQVELAKRISSEAELIPDYNTEPSPEEVETANNYLREILTQAGMWITLSEGYKGHMRTHDLMNSIPFAYLIDSYRNNQNLSETSMLTVTNDAWSVALAKEIKGFEPLLREKGVIKREVGERFESDVKAQVLSAKITIPEGDGVACFTSETLSKAIASQIPGFFLEGIQNIEFHDAIDNKGFSVLTIEDSPYNEVYISNARTIILETAIHEIFENGKMYMTLDEMTAWEEAIKQDQQLGVTAVSWYAKAMLERSTTESDVYYAHKEDLCDSAAEYITATTGLYLKSPARFNFMVQYFSNHLPPEIAQTYTSNTIDTTKRFEASLVTTKSDRAEIRAPLLKHETLEKKDLVLSTGKVMGECIAHVTSDGKIDSTINMYGLPYVKVIKPDEGK